MMRSTRRARWVLCALALSLLPSVPVLAKSRAARSLADCTSFTQTDKGEDAVELGIHNSCQVPVSCTIRWRVVCAPESRSRRSVHAASKKLSLAEDTGSSVQASAAACGDDAFAIDQIQWGCEPSND